jgi:serine/threonine protein kinase
MKRIVAARRGPQNALPRLNRRYVPIKVIGRGSFGVVYLVRRQSDSRQCVLKLIDMSNLSERDRSEATNECEVRARQAAGGRGVRKRARAMMVAAARTLRVCHAGERRVPQSTALWHARSARAPAQVLQKLRRHPQIIRILEHFYDDDGKLAIVMDYADGGDLSQRIDAQKQLGTRGPPAQALKAATRASARPARRCGAAPHLARACCDYPPHHSPHAQYARS